LTARTAGTKSTAFVKVLSMACRRRLLGVVTALLLAAACGGGGEGGPSASNDAISQRVIDYFQKTVTTPGLNFKVTKIEDSEVPGWRKGNLEVSLGPQTQNVAFYVNRDGRYLFRGDAIDLTIDPLKQVMNKISLDNQPERGAKDAKVTIVEYSDFQCPFCARVYTTLENEVLKDYGDKVRFVFKNFPLSSIHPWAEDGAVAAECAFQQGNDKFWPMYNGLFSKQSEISKDNLKEKASAIAKDGGLDVGRFQECLDGKQAIDAVKADESEGTALGVNSTPTFFINGRRLSGAQSTQDFKQMIDQELGKS
jgi:protein-disulfide isomerase